MYAWYNKQSCQSVKIEVLQEDTSTRLQATGNFLWCEVTTTATSNVIVPVPYPILRHGPVGRLSGKLYRQPYRPSHFHFIFEKPGYDRLVR